MAGTAAAQEQAAPAPAPQGEAPAAAPAAAAPATPAATTGDAARGRLLTYTCQGCHGVTGYKNVYPSYKVPMIGGTAILIVPCVRLRRFSNSVRIVLIFCSTGVIS